VLRIDESQEIEETVAYHTLGTIVHDTLQEFYEPLIGKLLTIEALNSMKPAIEKEISRQFKKTFRQGNFSTGKNLIIFEVAKRYISNFIDYEISEVKKGNNIKILNIESPLNVQISIEEIDFPIRIRGKVDRVDEYNRTLRIIDYKTGLVKQGDLEIVDWNLITQDYKYSKAVQVLTYALMIQNDLKLTDAEAGIISFKNLNSGFLKFGVKEKQRGGTKDYSVTPEVLDLFIVELTKLILEICDPETPFIEKEIA
jgi:ATP-dependent helicase/DNAse subunit B